MFLTLCPYYINAYSICQAIFIKLTVMRAFLPKIKLSVQITSAPPHVTAHNLGSPLTCINADKLIFIHILIGEISEVVATEIIGNFIKNGLEEFAFLRQFFAFINLRIFFESGEIIHRKTLE